jgi:transposase InsO family protein
MWGTDATSTVTLEDGSVAVFVAIDHCTLEGVGIHAATRATRFEALEPIRQGVRRQFGTFSPGSATGVQVRHDHGSQYMSDDFQTELRFLGMTSSPAFVRAPEGNGVAERFIRTLKEQLLWVRTFQTVEDLRLALHDWLRLYNEQWLVERHGFRSPIQLRRDLLATPEAA